MAFGDFTVTRASTKLRIGSNGLYGSVANNVPAFEFNANGTYRGLLVEPGATNLALRSQEFDNASWIKETSTVSANATTAPDGTLTADKLIGDNLSIGSAILQGVATLASTVYTYSVFVKAGESSWVQIIASGDIVSTPARFWVNLATGASGTKTAGFSTVSVSNVGSGWYRISGTFTTSVAGNSNLRVTNATGDNINGFAGDGTSGIFIWQAQLETGSVATSPIVTTAGTASRVADVVSLTGASSLIGQTEGTMFAEFELRDTVTSVRQLQISDGTLNNRVQLGSGSGTVGGAVVTGGVVQASLSTAVTAGVIKTAIAYASNDVAFYANGSSVGTDTSATIPACSRVDIGNTIGVSQLNGWIRSVALFPTRLLNASLASITTL